MSHLFRSISSTSLQHLSNTFWRSDLPSVDFDLELDDSQSEADNGNDKTERPIRRQSERYKI